ncbi:hypothetical protein SVI_0845 [Shewanella violacea DSS12]|uniref:Uncharacterized protein n=1 Tax=Shewanella violacea (strain JCM 10179 / CIP 106290 / LMG 19151 / DSS12) TaxID=637905 RepID=D4ZGL7_SHEVD|nr:hypothetical protein SVI_0845 [Shewanella violacea DSS12]
MISETIQIAIVNKVSSLIMFSFNKMDAVIHMEATPGGLFSHSS